jgi:spermidine synthase
MPAGVCHPTVSRKTRRHRDRPTAATSDPAPYRSVPQQAHAAPALPPLLVCFFFSGLAALIYETLWTREFAFVFGTSELATATVLAAYMGGLAAGAAVAARLAPRVRRPLLTYGVLEMGVGLSACAVPSAVGAATGLAVLLFGGRSEPPAAAGLPLALFYVAAAFVILLVPTALMGATLPLLARHAVRDERQIAPRVGALYGVNTLGAVVGTVAAAFVLVPLWGLRRTALVAVAANALAGVVAILAARATRRVPPPVTTSPAGVRRRSLPGRRELILPLMLVSGAVSFTYEVLWTRVLGHVLGGSTYAFATMLASFLVGIAAGSAVAARLAATSARAARGFAAAELGVAVLSYAAFTVMDRIRPIAAALGAGMAPASPGNAVLAAAAMLPAALCIGATFPFAVRVLARDDADAGPASARVYAWNTVGAIAGALAAGFVLIPHLGYAGTVTLMVASSAVLALLAASAAAAPSRALAVAAALGLVVLALARPETPWRLLGGSALNLGRASYRPIFLGIGRSATVTVTREAGVWVLRTNGLPEGQILPAGSSRRSRLEPWLGGLPAMVRPEARSMLMIGLGAGTALEAVPRTIETIDVVELEPEVIRANRFLSGGRAVDPLADPRVRLHVNDARNALLLTDRRWDAIVSQPSHPWTAGASHLYTREFFQLVRSRLTRDGVFVQWIELSFVDEALLRTLVATLHDVFADVLIFRPVFRSGVLFLAADRLPPLRAAVSRAIARAPQDLEALGVLVPEDVAAALAVDGDGVRRLAGGAAINTDDRNLIAARAAGVHAPLGIAGGDRVLAPLDPLPAMVPDVDGLLLVRRLLADDDAARATRVAGAMRDSERRAVATALIDLAAGRAEAAERRLREVLARDPGSYWGRVTLLRARRDALAGAATDAVALAESLAAREPTAAVIEGWDRERRGDWRALAALEGRLAAIAVTDPLYPDAVRLRARWRVEIGDAGRRAEAVRLIDGVAAAGVDPSDAALRARASRRQDGGAARARRAPPVP